MTRPHCGARPALTPDQAAQAVRLVRQGWSYREVAAALGIARRTVGHYVTGRVKRYASCRAAS